MKWKSSYLPYWLVALLLFLLVSSRSQIRSRLTGCVNHYCPLVFIVFMCKFQGYWVSAACLTFHKTPFFLALSLARICFLFLCCHSCICLQLYATSYRLRFGPFESNCIVLIDWNSWPLGLFSVEVFFISVFSNFSYQVRVRVLCDLKCALLPDKQFFNC